MEVAQGSVNLRPLEPADAEVMTHWAADAEFCREAGWTVGLSFAEHRRFHQAMIRSPPAGLIRLGATHRGALIGYVDLHGIDSHQRELGFLIGERSRWGRGLGYLAGAAGLDLGFNHLGLHQIWAEALDANQRSVRILQRLGFIETGRGAEGAFLDQPSHYSRFETTATDWLGRRP